MKKNSLLKVLLIVLGCIIFLSWIIPTGSYEQSEFVSSGLKPVGLLDLTLIPLTVFDLALPTIILALVVGGFYGVINKTGVYSQMIDSIVNKLKGKEIRFLVVITVVMTILSAIVGLNFTFFFIIPFLATLLFNIGFSKITTMLATFGSILVGMIGSIYGNDVAYILNGYFGYNNGYNYNTSIFPDKIILLFLLVFLLTMFVLKHGKNDLKEKKKELEEIPLYEKQNKSKKNWIPLFVIMVISFIFIVVGSFKWDSVLFNNSDKTPFLDFYQKIVDFKVAGFPIVSSIIGTFPAIGYWEMPFIAVLILFITIVIALVYKVKFDDAIEGFGKGLKETLGIAFYIIGANLVLALLFKNGNSANLATTIVNYLLSIPGKFNSAIVSITTIISSFFFSNNFSTLVSNMYLKTTVLTGSTVNLRFLATLIIQTLYGLVMLIAPTSVLLITGLAYYKISYKEWFKNVWKLLLQILIVIVIIIIIVTVFSVYIVK